MAEALLGQHKDDPDPAIAGSLHVRRAGRAAGVALHDIRRGHGGRRRQVPPKLHPMNRMIRVLAGRGRRAQDHDVAPAVRSGTVFGPNVT